MSKKLKTKISKSFIAICLPVMLMGPVLVPLFFPSVATAEIKNLSAQRDRTILYALIRCMKDVGPSSFYASVGGDALRGTNLEGVSPPDHLGTEMAVGYEIDEQDGNADCRLMSLNRAMRPIDKTPRWFFSQIFDLNNPINADGKLLYPRKNDGVSRIAGTLNQAMGGRDLSIGSEEKQRRLAVAFWVCAEPAPDPPDRETSTIGGKKYQLREDAPGEVSVGYDMTKGGEDDNGKYRCDTLLKWGNKNEMAAALRKNPQGSTPGSNGSGAGNNGQDDEQLADCDAKLSSVLSWILCPIIDMASNTTDFIYGKVIKPMLDDSPVSAEANGPSSGPYKAWQGFRILGNIILIGAMLALVYGTTRGGQ